MQIQQQLLRQRADSATALAALQANPPDLLLVFGALSWFEDPGFAEELRAALPDTVLAGCSTAGEIAGQAVYDRSCVLAAVHFDQVRLKAVSTPVQGMADSFQAGQRLAAALPAEGLRAVLVFGTGVAINGSGLAAGLEGSLPAGVTISGGLAADGGAFKRTWTLGPAGTSDSHVVAIGLYGEALRVAYGSVGGWAPFGPARRVTRCDQNVLYELDGKRALDIYKAYLGEYAKDLPASGLLFPFEMLGPNQEKSGIFRTILAVDEDEGSLTLAGDIDPNGFLKLMHASTEHLIEGAEQAAEGAAAGLPASGQRLAVLVSCIGRKLVMGDRVDEEVEAVAEVLGQDTEVVGFYSNGEIAPGLAGSCRLHNQTMTITWLGEA